jgi:hypothetical protein
MNTKAVNAPITSNSTGSASLRSVRRYTANLLDSNFGKKCLKNGNPFAVAFDKALDAPFLKSNKG